MPPPRRRGYLVRQPRSGPIIACCLAAFAAAVLYIPGVLIFPRGVDAEAAGRRSALLKDVLTQMQGRTSDLKALLQKDCNAIRAEIDGSSKAGFRRQRHPCRRCKALFLLPMVGSPAAAPPPTDPAAVQPADASAPPPGPIDLASRAERGVVLVVAKESTGSGFFVSPDTIVTNRHVVVEEPDGIQIVSKYVGVLPAKVGTSATTKRWTSRSFVSRPKMPSQPLRAHDAGAEAGAGRLGWLPWCRGENRISPSAACSPG